MMMKVDFDLVLKKKDVVDSEKLNSMSLMKELSLLLLSVVRLMLLNLLCLVLNSNFQLLKVDDVC